MFQIIGTIIFGAVIGVLARIVIDCDGCARRSRRPDRLLAVGTSGRRQHPRHRLDPVGDQCRCGGDLELRVHRDHAQKQDRIEVRLG